MPSAHSIRLSTFAVALIVATCGAQAFDESRYPDLKGQWRRVEPGDPTRFDPSKPAGLGQQAPLTSEYQALFEAGVKDLEAGGAGLDPSYTCLPPGMPRAMNAYTPMEVVVTPDTTFILIDHIHDNRRIFTDGRDWPPDMEPMLMGTSIGKWLDTTGSGRYDVLAVETRGFKGPRAFDSSGIPLHHDNQTIVKERIYLDKSDKDQLRDEVTTIDNALTRPWTVTKTFSREHNPIWFEYSCPEGNHHVRIGKDNYYVSEDGFLMPVRKNQAPPDMKYFTQTPK